MGQQTRWAPVIEEGDGRIQGATPLECSQPVLTRSQLHACRKFSKLGSSLQALGHVAPVVAMDTSHTHTLLIFWK